MISYSKSALRCTPQTITRAKVKVRSLKPSEKLRIYQRDGFVDRYSPERWRLVHPGALRALSLRLPKWLHTSMGPHNIPAKHATNSPVWFDVWPAVDHVIPRAHSSGSNAETNLRCVSWWRDTSKGDRLLEETGWQLQPGGDLSEWDGLQGWFLKQIERNPSLLNDSMVRNWHFPF